MQGRLPNPPAGLKPHDTNELVTVDPTMQEATPSIVISMAESLDEPERKPVSTNDIPVNVNTSAGFFIVIPLAR